MGEEYRPLRADELDQQVNMGAQAFRVGPRDAARWRETAELEKLRGYFVDGEMKSSLGLHDMQMWVMHGTVPAGGLAGVATPPENRRQGYIQKMLHAVLSELRDRDMPLSILYPFHFPFYKRYGWAHVTDNVAYKIPPDRLPLGSPPGSWHKVYVHANLHTDNPDGDVPDAELAVLREIYDQWCVGRTGPILRDERWWRRRKLGIGREQRPDVYYWRNPAGQARAYVIYSWQELDEPWSRRIRCELAALDHTALRASLQFLRNHDSQAKEISLTLPEDMRFLALLDDPEFPIQVEPGMMLRLVDIPDAIAARRSHESVSAEFTMEVSDSFLAWNNGTYHVHVIDGAARVERTAAAPGLRLDQRALAQIYAGYLMPADALDLGLLEELEPGAMNQMSNAFAGPRLFIPDFF